MSISKSHFGPEETAWAKDAMTHHCKTNSICSVAITFTHCCDIEFNLVSMSLPVFEGWEQREVPSCRGLWFNYLN